MVYLAMALWLDFGKGYVRVLRNLLRGLRWARGGWDGYVVPTDGAISRARDRLGSAPLRALFEVTAKPTVSAGHDEVFWRDLRKVVVDGTVFDVPASTDNASAFDTPADGVLPRARLVALAECGSMALIGAAFDSIEVGERALFERLLGKLTPGMPLLADRGFPSYDLYTASAATGAHLLWRVSDSFTLPVKKRLEDGTYLSELRGKRTRERVTVRVIEYSVTDDDGVSEVFALITTLLNPEQAPALELARIYADRWHVEILFRLVKVDLRTPGGVLRSRTAEGVRQELWALLCLYQALRTLITRAAVIAGVDPTRISFPPVLDAVNDSVATAFPPEHPSQALKFFIADLPRWVIRDRPDRTAPHRSRPNAPARATRPAAQTTQEPASSPTPSPCTSSNHERLKPWPLTPGPLPSELSGGVASPARTIKTAIPYSQIVDEHLAVESVTCGIVPLIRRGSLYWHSAGS